MPCFPWLVNINTSVAKAIGTLNIWANDKPKTIARVEEVRAWSAKTYMQIISKRINDEAILVFIFSHVGLKKKYSINIIVIGNVKAISLVNMASSADIIESNK